MASNDMTERSLKSYITSIITSNPMVSTIQSIEKDYIKLIGTPVPYRTFGFNSVEQLLKNIPDTCVVQGTGSLARVNLIPSEKSAHINKMVMQQKVNSKSKKRGPRRKSPKNMQCNREYHKSSSSGDHSSECPSLGNQFTNNNHSEIRQTNIYSTHCEPRGNFTLGRTYLGNRRVLDSLIQRQVEIGNVTKSSVTSPPKIDKTEPVNNSPKFHKQESSQETSDIYGESCFNASKDKLNNNSEEEVEDTSNVPKRVQSNLRTLISQFRNGIWCSDIPGHYKRLFKKDLLYMEYGYTSLIEMFIALRNIFHYVRPGRDDFKLYDRSKPLPENVEKLYTMASYDIGEKISTNQALPDLDWCDFRGYIPDDVFKYGNEIPKEFLPVGTRVESIFDVVVVEVYDPSKFWFYFGTSKSKTPLDDLMDDLQMFYNDPDNAKDYAIPPGAVMEGLYCVQVIFGEYHRAKIVRVLADSPDHVRVFYIDYGTVCKVPIKGLCFLHSKFATLSAQAIRCRLANIVPTSKGNPWPRTTSDRFRELVNKRDTKIKVSHIDWNEEQVWVFLADVTDKDNVCYINETLVKEGHAVWDGESQIVPFVLSNFNCKVQNLHLFPTFLELEYGLVPNIGEMYALEDMQVPLQFCLPEYFEPNKEILSSDDEGYDEMEKSFIETVKSHRSQFNSTAFDQVDIDTILNPPPIDFDLFGELKDEMIEFYNSSHFREIEDVQRGNGHQGVCDLKEKPVGENLEDCQAQEREICEPIRLVKQDKELSESIIKKLERYTMLETEWSLGSKQGRLDSVESRNLEGPYKYEVLDLDLQEELFSPEEMVENELSTILEQSELETDTSTPESPIKPFFPFGLNSAQPPSDINIFDNPEEFERMSDVSENDEVERPVTPESFLRTIDRISRKNFGEEEFDVFEENSSTENASAIAPNSEKAFKFDVNPELKEAFKTFLKSKKRDTLTFSSDSSDDPSLNLSNQSEQLLLGRSDDGGDCNKSFVKCDNKNFRLGRGIGNARMRYENNLTNERSKIDEAEVDSHPKSNLQECRKDFVSSLSLNNPFRCYLQTNTEDENNTELSTVGTSESLSSSATNLFESIAKLKEAHPHITPTITSESEGSDYRVFVPRSSRNENGNFPVQENLEFCVQVPPLVRREIATPPRVCTPQNLESWVQVPPLVRREAATPPLVCLLPRTGTSPRLFVPPTVPRQPRVFIPSGSIPGGCPPYPQWSNGGGFPIPQYPAWSNGGNDPHLSQNYYPLPRDNMRPPPGFSYQGPPQGYPPYMAPRMPPAPSMYPQYSGSVYYGPPRQMQAPPLVPENDFYERYNENLLRMFKDDS